MAELQFTDDDIIDDPQAPEGLPDADPVAVESTPEPTSIAEGDGTDEPTSSPSVFPEDWREQMAGDDEKVLNQLKRFTSPQMLVKSWTDTRAKLSSAPARTELPENASEEQLSAWRAENGVPESWEAYQLDLGEGVVLGEDDKPVADSFMQFAHGKNLPNEAVSTALQWYYDYTDTVQQDLYNTDREFREAANHELRTEWGNEYKANLNAIKNVVGEELSGLLFGARAESGERLGDHPGLLKFLAQTARELNPAATVVPGAGANSLQAVGDELRSIEALMGDHSSEYWKGPKAESMQARYVQLITAQQRLKGN